MLKAFFNLILSLLKHFSTFFFNKTRQHKNKTFWLFFLALSDRNILEPFCECSFLQQQVPLFSAIIILGSILIYLYFFYIWWCFKNRKQVKNKWLINMYLQLNIIKFFNSPVINFFLFENFNAVIFFLSKKLSKFFRFLFYMYETYFLSIKMDTQMTKILQYLKNKIK